MDLLKLGGITTNKKSWEDMAHKLNNSRRTIAVDFDGVIAEYDGYKGPGVLGDPRQDVREALRELRSEGWKIIIHTTPVSYTHLSSTVGAISSSLAP